MHLLIGRRSEACEASMGGRLFAEFLSPMWPKCDQIAKKNCYELSKTRFKAEMEADHG